MSQAVVIKSNKYGINLVLDKNNAFSGTAGCHKGEISGI